VADEAKTFTKSFDEQLEAAEKLYGYSLKFSFSINDVEKLLNEEAYYPSDVKNRVKDILALQRRKYQYLFV
jgi:hypothetical protein